MTTLSKSLGFVFPGQGSQSVGMLADISQHYSEVKHTFAEASAILGYDLWKLVAAGPAEELDKTTQTQPALLAASYAIWQIIQKRHDLQPALLAGHSLGEYTALVCAEAIAFSDAIKLVAARGQFMQDAVPIGQGALAAIVGLDDEVVKQLCQTNCEKNEVLAPVNFNCPGQVVVGGHSQAVQRIIDSAKKAGARLAKQLPVSVPSHCSLMKPAAERLAEFLKDISINTPIFPIINNVDVGIYLNADSIREGLVRQLYMPVRWVEMMHAFKQANVLDIVECGPGKVLTGLNKRILPEAHLMATTDLPLLDAVCVTKQ